MKMPEAIVDPVDLYTRRSSIRLLIGQKSGNGDDGDDVHEQRLERRVASHAVSEPRAEKIGGKKDEIRSTEPLQNEIAETAPDRVADEKRSGENRHCGRDASQYRGICPPVIPEAAPHEVLHV
jgi:hypothetical protein